MELTHPTPHEPSPLTTGPCTMDNLREFIEDHPTIAQDMAQFIVQDHGLDWYDFTRDMPTVTSATQRIDTQALFDWLGY